MRISEGGRLMAESTVPQLLRRRAADHGAEVAMYLYGREGIRSFSWKESYEQVLALAGGLHANGLRRGDRFYFSGEVSIEVYWMLYAVWSLGAVALGGWPGASEAEAATLVELTESSFATASSATEVRKLVQVIGGGAGLKRVIALGSHPEEAATDDRVVSMEQLIKAGQAAAFDAAAVEREIDVGRPDEAATFYTTSGTTGAPKAAVHTHATLIEGTKSFLRVAPVTERDEHYPTFPIAAPAEPVVGSVNHVLTGMRLNFVEPDTRAAKPISDRSPAYMWMMPRQWEARINELEEAMHSAPIARRVGYRFARSLGAAAERLGRSPVGVGAAPLLRSIARRVGLDYARGRLGARRTRWAITGGYMPSSSTLERFQSLGIPLRQIYASSEMLIVMMDAPSDASPDRVGRPLPGVELRLTPEGELLVRSPFLFRFYHNNKAATEKAMTDDGWYRTGDLMYVDNDGAYHIIGRLADAAKLSDGTVFSGQYVEAHLKNSALVQDAMCTLGRGDVVVALLVPNIPMVMRLVRGAIATEPTELLRKPEVVEAFVAELSQLNAQLPRAARVRHAALLPHGFTADAGEVTRTTKLKRNVLEEHYSELIEALVAGDTAHDANGSVSIDLSEPSSHSPTKSGLTAR
jgi:long-chain acyl-CoA synthetase